MWQPANPLASRVEIVFLQFLNPVSASTMVGRSVTLVICDALSLIYSNVVRPISAKPKSLAITPPEI